MGARSDCGWRCCALLAALLLCVLQCQGQASPQGTTPTPAPSCEKAGEERDSQGRCRCAPSLARAYSARGDNSKYVCVACTQGQVPVEVVNNGNRGDTACCPSGMVAMRDRTNMAASCHPRKDTAPQASQYFVLNLPAYQPAPALHDGISPQEIVLLVAVGCLVLTVVVFVVRGVRSMKRRQAMDGLALS